MRSGALDVRSRTAAADRVSDPPVVRIRARVVSDREEASDMSHVCSTVGPSISVAILVTHLNGPR